MSIAKQIGEILENALIFCIVVLAIFVASIMLDPKLVTAIIEMIERL